MTLHELAGASKTSATTILRVLQTLGYSSYKDFQYDTQQSLLLETPVVFSRYGQAEINGAADTLTYVITNNCSDIQNNLNNMNIDSFEKAVELFIQARKIAFLGLRSSGFVAGYMHSMMSTFCDNCTLVQADGSEYIYERLQYLNHQDILVAVSMGGPHYTLRTLEAMKYSKARSIPIVLITSSMTNPAVTYADIVFIAHPSRYISIVSAMTIVDALIFEFFNRKKSLLSSSDLAKTLIENNILMGVEYPK